MTIEAQRWTVVLPVKPPERGKSRLSVGGLDRASIARALAIDTLAAIAGATRVGRILIVTADEEWAVELAAGRDGIGVVPELGVADLNSAVRAGALAASADSPVAVVVGDLPALTPETVDDVLAAAAGEDRAVVADGQGSGTTMLLAARPLDIQPAFGAGSLARHLALGYVPLALAQDSPARQDVDTAEDLVRIPHAELGVATRAILVPATP